jgi:RNA recognition motif-containing protein
MNIFVGNLAEAVTDVELADLFRAFGQVKSVEVKRELFTGKSRGFAFVEMPGKNHSLAAIAGLNGKELCGQPLKVHEARDRPGHGARRR